jgi:hypothetical protein
MTLRCAAQVDYSGLVLPLNTRFADFGFRHMIHVMKNDVPRALVRWGSVAHDHVSLLMIADRPP